MPLHDFPGIDTLQGKYFHSRDYKTPDKKVCVSTPPELDHPTLAVIGLVQPLGTVMPIFEMQARWATRVFKGCNKLSSMADMLKSRQEAMVKRYVTSQRHTIQADHVSYMDEIAELVGGSTQHPQVAAGRSQPGTERVARSLHFIPGSSQGARKVGGACHAILTQWERVVQPMQTRSSDQKKPKSSLTWPLTLSAAALGFAV
ncbi:hypothetical protein LDENG_00117450 [Lucifuga dentata]|nr:hypothetical protein LDENG_00117450 [Lucifuga dentata]